MVSISTDLQYITSPHQPDSGCFWESLMGFQRQGMAEDDQSVATLKHCKNGEC
jgi:hypothetical protein